MKFRAYNKPLTKSASIHLISFTIQENLKRERDRVATESRENLKIWRFGLNDPRSECLCIKTSRKEQDSRKKHLQNI